MRNILAAAAAVTLMSACATPYAPNSWWNDGGFTETEIQPGLWQVRFVGNEFTDEQTKADYAMLRASEICLEFGMPFMLVGSDAQNVTRSVAPAAGTRRYGSGRNAPTAASVQYSMSDGLTMRCAAGELPNAMNANFLANSIREKHDIY